MPQADNIRLRDADMRIWCPGSGIRINVAAGSFTNVKSTALAQR